MSYFAMYLLAGLIFWGWVFADAQRWPVQD